MHLPLAVSHPPLAVKHLPLKVTSKTPNLRLC